MYAVVGGIFGKSLVLLLEHGNGTIGVILNKPVPVRAHVYACLPVCLPACLPKCLSA